MLTPASQARKQILHPAHEGIPVQTIETTLPGNRYDSEFDLRGKDLQGAGILLRHDLDQCRFLQQLKSCAAGQVNGPRGLWFGNATTIHSHLLPIQARANREPGRSSQCGIAPVTFGTSLAVVRR
jgi:hypothetical protein